MAAPVTVAQLLGRGDRVAVQHGRLTITPASGRPIPADWLAQHERRLVADAARLAGVPALEYGGYSTGSYTVNKASQRRADGVTLQFRTLASGQDCFAIFNASTRRSRSSQHGKAGEPLPKGHFMVGRRSAFAAFWESTGLPYQRLSNLHQRMGRLAGLVYTASISNGERLDAGTLKPLDISAEELATLTNKPQTNRKQAANNSQTSIANKETPQPQQRQGLQPFSTTGQEKCGNTVIREHGYTGSPYAPSHMPCVHCAGEGCSWCSDKPKKRPQDQTIEEWLHDYNTYRD